MSKDTDEVVALERKFWSNANDPKFFQHAVADDGITVIEPMGFIQKADAVKYAGQGRAEGDKKPYQGSIASVYVKRDGRWQMALSAHQPWKPSHAKNDGKKS